MELALVRSRLYRWLSEAFDYPTEELVGAIQSGQFQEETASAAAQLPILDGEDDTLNRVCLEAFRRLAALRGTLTFDQLELDYVRTFGHALSRECPQYETEYIGDHIFYQTQELADIAAFYRAFGLEVANTAHERLDHASIELEWMQVVCAREAYARQQGHLEQVDICRDSESKFMEAHLGRWAPYFGELVGKAAAGTAYHAFADILRWFVAFETDYLGASPERVVSVRPHDPPTEADDEPQESSAVQWAGEMRP
jgi:TorA maturation chaperone TorD